MTDPYCIKSAGNPHQELLDAICEATKALNETLKEVKKAVEQRGTGGGTAILRRAAFVRPETGKWGTYEYAGGKQANIPLMSPSLENVLLKLHKDGFHVTALGSGVVYAEK